jgi:GDP-fucose protein O-fucosyltransferase
MTFEPDGGGWNNIRMAMETVVGLAVATGRTLVLPPAQRMYLLGQGHGTGVKTAFSFLDFFPMQEVAQEQEGLTIISTQEFLETVAMTGQLRDVDTGHISFPPDNRTDWDGADGPVLTRLKEWLRNVTHTPLWSPTECLAVFPASGQHRDALQLQEMLRSIAGTPSRIPMHLDTPLPVDAPTLMRLRESLTGRKQLCLYDAEMQEAPVLHFMCSHKLGVRMLVHFYAFLFFENWQEDLWMKRYVVLYG